MIELINDPNIVYLIWIICIVGIIIAFPVFNKIDIKATITLFILFSVFLVSNIKIAFMLLVDISLYGFILMNIVTYLLFLFLIKIMYGRYILQLIPFNNKVHSDNEGYERVTLFTFIKDKITGKSDRKPDVAELDDLFGGWTEND